MCYFNHFWANDDKKLFSDWVCCGEITPRESEWYEVTDTAKQDEIRAPKSGYAQVDSRGLFDCKTVAKTAPVNASTFHTAAMRA